MAKLPYPKIIGVIPARYGSRRFPGKMLAPILGKSLLQRTYENASAISLFSRLLVATDDARILEHACGFGAEAFLTPPCSTGTERVANLITEKNIEADIIVNIQGDEPCVSPEVFENLVANLLAHPDAAVATPVAALQDQQAIRNPSVVKCVFDANKRALYFSRSPIPYACNHSSPPVYYRHLGVYAFRRDFLLRFNQLESTPCQQAEDLEQLKILERGYPVRISVVEDFGIGVDTLEDLKHLEKRLCQESISSSQEALSPR